MNSRKSIHNTAFSKPNSTSGSNPFQSRPFDNGVQARQPGLSVSAPFESRPFAVQTQLEPASPQQPETLDTEQEPEARKHFT